MRDQLSSLSSNVARIFVPPMITTKAIVYNVDIILCICEILHYNVFCRVKNLWFLLGNYYYTYLNFAREMCITSHNFKVPHPLGEWGECKIG